MKMKNAKVGYQVVLKSLENSQHEWVGILTRLDIGKTFEINAIDENDGTILICMEGTTRGWVSHKDVKRVKK